MKEPVDFTRLDNLVEAFGLYKIKTCADIEGFIMNPEISTREKIESLYIMSYAYMHILDYIDKRIDEIDETVPVL